jgi:uncharacterized protein YecT (DUF1311 family)
MELTDRLRAANDGTIAHRSPEHIYAEDDKREIVNAESTGKEGPVRSPRERLRAANEVLNVVFSQLLSELSPKEKTAMEEQQRRWQKQRELFAAIHQNQSWSLFRYASEAEGRAIATEQRVAQLQALLKKSRQP